MRSPSASTTRPAEQQRRRTRTVAVAIALTALVCVVALASREPLRGTTGPPTDTPEGSEDVVVIAPAPDFPVPGALPPEVFVIDAEESSGTPAWLPWTLAGVGLAGIAAAGLLLARDLRRWGGGRGRRRRARRKAAGSPVVRISGVSGEDEAERARRAVETAMEPLRNPTDPRAAVIAAYASMEKALAERELGRRTPEAPREYLARVLREQGMPDRSLTTLTTLFEEARFSLHPIPRSAPGRALRALENVVILGSRMPRFVVQLHDATTLHFDLRLQIGDVLRSWAVPKGPSLDPAVRRLAVPVADHSLEAGEFEGVHEGQGRGSGAVIVWDEGTAEVLREEPDHLAFELQGQKLSGRFGLSRTGERRWILVKASDEHARPGSDIVAERPASVRSGKTWEELAGTRGV
jgi:DNA ligase D-like protein (predicted 3'-phosphoesterase)